jgi:hypothetical protein
MNAFVVGGLIANGPNVVIGPVYDVPSSGAVRNSLIVVNCARPWWAAPDTHLW